MENNEGYKLIERLILGRRLKKQYVKLRKMYRYRKNVIAEIMKTEQSYVTDLQIIQNKLLDQLTFTKYTMENLFSNFPKIIEINEPMCADMLQRIESENKRQLQIYENEIVKIKALFPQYNKPFNYSYGHENSVIFDLMLKYTFFFDKYFPYCQSFGNAQQNRQEQLKNDPGFSEIIQQLLKDPIFRCLDLEGFMVKPVQRLPKYVLLLKDLLKHTPEYHPDYRNIQQTLAKFEEINFQNNQKMDEFLNKQKINELQQQFPSEKKVLEGKKFLLEENVELFITLRDLRPVVLYLFHDLIIITEHDHSLFGADKYKVKFRIPISFQTQCLEIQESKFYKNAFKIVNQKIFQFSCSDTKSKKQLVGLINDQIQAYSAKAFEDISIDNQEVKVPPIVVKLKGTEEHNIASLNHYTVYVIQIKMDHMAWTIYNRYSQLKALYEFICLKYRNKVKFTNFLHSNWLRNHENKYLEMRKIGIENFLQQLFVSQLMQEPKPQREILERLGMPTNFFKLYQIVENDQQMRNDQQDNTIGDFNYQHENNQVIQSFLQNVQIQTILDNKLNQADQFIDIWVHVHLSKNESEQIRKYKIKPLTKSVLLCAQIASELKLDSFFDFRLFVTDSKGNTRPIECNQTLIQSLPKDPTIFNNDSPMTKVSKFFIEQFDEVYHLEFKKYVTFPPKFEAEEYNKCEIRLELITEQLFQAVQSEQYKLTPNQYALVYALYLLAKYNEQQIYEIKQTNLMHYFKYVGPRKIYKHFSKEQWKVNFNLYKQEYVNKYLDQLNKKINQIVQDKGLEQRKKSLIARKILIRSMEDVELYGCTLFYVGYDRDNVDMFEKNGIQKYFNLYIAVSYKRIYLLTPSQKDIIKKYEYKDFQKITVEPLAIIFQISADNQLSFNTTDSYRIYKLIEDYKEILKYIKK